MGLKTLGIDPGFGILGWAVIEDTVRVIDYGCIETETGMPIDERLFIIHTGITELVRKYRPDRAAIERLFFARNTTTAMDVSKAVGVVLLAFRQHALSYREFTPTQVKQCLTGYARADKAQMQFMITRLFSLPEPPRPDDAADALAIALCGALAAH